MKGKTKVKSESVKHTPGPWGVWLGSQVTPEPKDGTFEGPTICLCNKDRSEYEDNAKLIAAAPELLEACKAVLHCNDYCSPRDISVLRTVCSVTAEFSEVLKTVQSAIAKAERNL